MFENYGFTQNGNSNREDDVSPVDGKGNGIIMGHLTNQTLRGYLDKIHHQ